MCLFLCKPKRGGKMNTIRETQMRMTSIRTRKKNEGYDMVTHNDAFETCFLVNFCTDLPFRQIFIGTCEIGECNNHSSCWMNNVVVFLLRHFIQSNVIIECLMKMLFSPWYYVSWRRPCYFERFSMSVQTTRITKTTMFS